MSYYKSEKRKAQEMKKDLLITTGLTLTILHFSLSLFSPANYFYRRIEHC